jgi:putative addiction module killer protein
MLTLSTHTIEYNNMTKPVQPKTLTVYQDADGNEPFTNWFNSLRDVQGRQRIGTRLRRLEQGNYGDCQSIGEGISELRMFFGPGYRVYFGEEGDNIVLLLCGGDKSSQTQDIEVAKAYWKEHLSHA